VSKQTVLNETHRAQGAVMVDFAGWDMPVHYGSQIDEHHAVRNDAGMFDVSHMTIVDVAGVDATRFLRAVLANDVARLQPSQALYSCMLNESGGVIDDLIAYHFTETDYRLVVNAATRDKDMAWLNEQAKKFDVTLNERSELSMIAVQGPNAIAKVLAAMDEKCRPGLVDLKPFYAARNNDSLIARTGYTGEPGYEMILPNDCVVGFWTKLLAQGVVPCGLGARDTLRLEAGLNLYSQDMTEETTPLETNLAWTVAFSDDRDFIGKAALLQQKADGVARRLVGLVLQGRGVLRAGLPVFMANGEKGVVTSGTFSPTLKRGIALALVPKDSATQCDVEIRGKRVAASIVKAPFVKQGKPTFTLEKGEHIS
jgi:aminomethyltransferase